MRYRKSYYNIGKPRKRDNPEGRLLLQIIKYCKFKGAYVGKVKTTGAYKGGQFIKDPYLMRGLPDCLCFYNNKMYFFETKVGKNGLTPHQQTFQLVCRQANIPYVVIRDLETIQKIIQ